MARLSIVVLALGVIVGCSDPEPEGKDNGDKDAASVADSTSDATTSGGGDKAAMKLVEAVKETESWQIAGLKAPVHVVRTKGNVAHIYAADRADLSRVHGFVAARDRFFVMDMMRRLGQGRVSEVFGDVALGADIQSRGTGMTMVADRVCNALSDEMKTIVDAYAAGVNAYIAAVKADKLPPPSELKLASGLLGYKQPSDAMHAFERRDVCAAVAVVLFQQGYESDDIKRAARRASVESATQSKNLAGWRRKGLLTDVIGRQAPLYKVTTTPGYGLDGTASPPPPQGGAANSASASKVPATGTKTVHNLAHLRRPPHFPSYAQLNALSGRLDAFGDRLGKSERGSFGSNIWAVAGTHTKSGGALLASDGHLSLSVPALFWQIGLDTAVFGGGKTHQTGLTFAGLPVMAAGTNGDLAWSNTYLYGDITDYYAEQLTLDAAGAPVSIVHGGETKKLIKVVEKYDTAKVSLLGSPGGNKKIARYETWDGRRLVDIEGRVPTEEEIADPSKLSKGETMVNLLGEWVIPGDKNKDGNITAITMDLTTFDVGDTPTFVDRIGHAKTVTEARNAQKGLVGWAQNTMYADRHGNIAYSGYNPTPCRSYLERVNGTFAADSNPQELLDGAKYRGFVVSLKSNGEADEEADSKDPYKCLIPFGQWPQAQNPSKGYIVNANNDFSGTSVDGVFGNDKWYVGGPWVLGLRAKQLDDAVAAAASSKKADIPSMQAAQALHKSLLGCTVAPIFKSAVARAKALAAKDKTNLNADEKDAVAAHAKVSKAADDAIARMDAWVKRGCPAESGVETFYHQPTADQKTDAVATMIFNAAFAELLGAIWADEGVHLDAVDVLRATITILQGRGKDNPAKLASWRIPTEESVFFDNAVTTHEETSDTILMQALANALTKLASKEKFGTDDASKWLWGLEHVVEFKWLLASFLDGQPALASIGELFSITPAKVPLADKFDKGDPRKNLEGFPRPGDYGGPDAAAPNAIRGYNGGAASWNFRYSHGPVMRMVIELGPGDAKKGENIIPGGQSALTDSDNFDDQVRVWLGNKTWTMPLTVEAVTKAAIGREVYRAK